LELKTFVPLNKPFLSMHSNTWLRRFSKLTCFSTLFLIFVGGMVTSTDSGLAVPDWPLSYGTLFPPMIGGIFYEHGHRMVASCVGFLTLCLTIWLWRTEQRRWVRNLGIIALLAVLLQGLLGGLTVLFYLPTPISVMHGVLAQTFFSLTIIIAYSQSVERQRYEVIEKDINSKFLRLLLGFILLIYLQLIFGAIMRHTGSGLAIPDFPKMGGYWLPPFNAEMVQRINVWQFEQNFEFVTLQQISFHFIHRLGALFIVIGICVLNLIGLHCYKENKQVLRTIYLLDSLVFAQALLGITIVATMKAPVITSLHVVNGAAILGMAVLLFLRAAPISYHRLKESL